jgi:hypothetical protein
VSRRRSRSGEDADGKRHAASTPSHWHTGDAAELEFLDKELLSWWLTEDNFSGGRHFLVMRSSLEPQACFAARQERRAKAQLNALMEEMVF